MAYMPSGRSCGTASPISSFGASPVSPGAQIHPSIHAASDFSRHYRAAAAKYRHYANIDLRVGSFLSWPEDKSQTPRSLSEAGFFFAGVEDCTRCFYCGGGLRNWLPGDNPWVEHARWFPTCEFVRQEKGGRFVDNVNQDYPRGEGEVLETDADETVTDYNELVQRVLQKPCGASLQVLDFPSTVIIAAITKVLSESGWDENRVTAEKLALVAFDLQDAESEHATTELTLVDKVHEDGPDTEPSDPVCGGSGDSDASCSDQDRLLEENSRLKSQMMCKVCKRNGVSNVFLPCGHLVTCPECGLRQTHCVLCHQAIAANIKVYV